LLRAASLFRGPILADLELSANSEFHSWLLALREDARKLRSQILRALTERLRAIPHEALPFARELVRVDPYDETAWALLIATLASGRRSGEVRQQ
jgi:DNA-binding SARP family transcriptional activator